MSALMITKSIEKGMCSDTAWYVQKLKNELEGVKYIKCFENWLSGVTLIDELCVSWRCRQTIDHHGPLSEKALNLDILSRDMVPANSNPRGKQWQEI